MILLMSLKGVAVYLRLLLKTNVLMIFIYAAQTSDKSAVTPEQMDELIQVLRQDYDYILIDCPAGIEQGFKMR